VWAADRLIIVARDGVVWSTRDGAAWTSLAVPATQGKLPIGVRDGAIIAWDEGAVGLHALSLAALDVTPAKTIASGAALIGAWQCTGDEAAQALTMSGDQWYLGALPATPEDQAWAFDGTYVRWSSVRYDCGDDAESDSPCVKQGAYVARCGTITEHGAALEVRYGYTCDALDHVMACSR